MLIFNFETLILKECKQKIHAFTNGIMMDYSNYDKDLKIQNGFLISSHIGKMIKFLKIS